MVKSNKKLNRIYMDYAAGVKANPSSIHEDGIKAKKELQKARVEVANILSARPSEIIFTSGGTESNNLAIQGVVWSFIENQNLTPSPLSLLRRGVGERWILPHIITTNIEHPSVLETCKMLERRGLIEISIVAVENNGIVDPKKIKKEIKKNTILVSVMYANNEIGTIQLIREIAKEIRHYRKTKVGSCTFGEGPTFAFPIFHTDAVQAVNYLDLNIEKLGVDMLSMSGSKIEGAGRVGVLYRKRTVPLSAIFGGGDQEMGLRPGTENLTEIVKFSEALKLVQKNKEKENKRLTKLRDYFIKKLQKLKNQKQNFRAGLVGVGDPGIRGPEKIFVFDFLVNGDLKNRLSNNINVTFTKIPSDLLVIELSAKGIMASSKSACKSSRKEGSYVIEAIRSTEALPPSICGGNASVVNASVVIDPEIGGLRFSLGKDTTKADIDYTIKALSQILLKLKEWYT